MEQLLETATREPGMSLEPGQKPRVTAAYKRLLGLIQERGLDRGDRLPAQSELRQLLSTSNKSINEAMRWLADDGVLSRSRHHGTVVVEPTQAMCGLSIGLLVTRPEPVAPSPFVCSLLYYLQHRLSSLGTRFGWVGPFEQSEMRRLMNDKVQVSKLAMAEKWDTIVTLTGVSAENCQSWWERGVAFCHVGNSQNAMCGVVVDQEAMVKQATTYLSERGCRRLLLVLASTDDGMPARDPLVAAARSVASEHTTVEAVGAFIGRGAHTDTEDYLVAGRRIAAEIAGREAGRSPDGVIVLDDHIASGLCVGFAEANCNPMVAVQTNAQVRFDFALPIRRYEVDLDLLAERAAALALRLARRQVEPPAVERVVPRPYEGSNP